MARPSKHHIPPSLARQLDRLELIGNAEAELIAQESNGEPDFTAPRVKGGLSTSERQHRLDTAREQFLRETQRTKKFGFILLALVPVTCLSYAASIMFGNSILGLLSTLFAGLLIGFGGVVIFMSKRNISALTDIESE